MRRDAAPYTIPKRKRGIEPVPEEEEQEPPSIYASTRRSHVRSSSGRRPSSRRGPVHVYDYSSADMHSKKAKSSRSNTPAHPTALLMPRATGSSLFSHVRRNLFGAGGQE